MDNAFFIKLKLFIAALLLLASCQKSDDLYDRIGFEGGRRPHQLREYNEQDAPRKTLQPVPRRQNMGANPDYYYRQPVYPYPAASRYYNNPYSFQPRAQYPYYDADHYYAPPASAGYGNENFEGI